jgi:hypothetical protein
MKKFFTMLTFLIFSCSAFTQSFAPIGAVWYYGASENPTSGNAEGYIKLESYKDTTLMTKNCHTLKRTIYNSNGTSNKLSDLIMYQDLNKIYQFIYGKFYTLYDFTAKKGDTLKIAKQYISSGTDTTFKCLVDSVGTKTISGKVLRFYNIKYNASLSGGWMFSGIMTEAIGAAQFMFPQNQLSCDNGCYGPLRCYNDGVINYTSGIQCDKVVTAIEETSEKSSWLKTSPNPANDNITVKMNLSNGPNFDNSVCLVNMYGQTLQSINMEFINNQEIQINLTGLKSGVYFIRAFINGYQINNRIIKN